MHFVVTPPNSIGNIIQAAPFMYWLKLQGHRVTARKGKGLEDVWEFLSPVYDDIVTGKAPVKGADKDKRFRKYCKRFNRIFRKKPVPEWGLHFLSYGFEPVVQEHPVSYTPSSVYFPVILAPCSKPNWPMKKWPYWRALAEQFETCAMIGLEQDGPDELPDTCRDLRGGLSLSSIPGLLASAGMVIAEEGGIAHMSCCVQPNTFILYGGTHPVLNRNVFKGHVLTCRKDMSCQPCQRKPHCVTLKRKGRKPPVYSGCSPEKQWEGFPACLCALTVDQVTAYIKDLNLCLSPYAQ